MSSEPSLSGNHNQTKISSSFGPFRRSLAFSLTLAVILTSLFYLLAPKLIRKYARRFKIGQIGFLSLKDLEWTSSHQNISTKHQDGFTTDEDQSDQNEGVKITVKSIGLRLGSNEGSRRQWIALRIDSPRIRIPKRRTRSNSFDSSSDSSEPEFSAAETSYRYGRSRKISGASSTSQLSGLSKSDAPPLQFLKTLSHKSKQATSSILRHLPAQAHPILRFLRKLLRLARLEIVRPLLNKLNRFGRRLSWIISVFGVEVNNIEVDVSKICRVTCTIKTGLQLSRGDNGKICCWIVVKKLQIHKLTTVDDTDPSEEDIKRDQAAQDTTAAFSFPGCIEISASAGLDPVIGLASIWAGSKAAGYTRRFPSSPYQNYPSNMPNGSWKRYIRPRSVNVTLKISEDLQASRRTSKKTSLSPNLKASSAFISIENALAITRALPNRTKTNESNGPSISILSDEPMFSGSNFSHLEDSQQSPSKVFSTLSIIRQFQISLPSLHCYYILAGPISTPISTSTSSPGTPATQNKKIAIDLQITRFIMNLDLSAEKTGKEAARSDRNLTTHMEWFGRGTPIPFRLNSQWKDISINATLVPESERSSELIPSGPTQLLRMSEVSFVLSSSWAPRTLREKIESENFSSHASQLSLNGDHNSHMIVAEFEIGKIRGQMPIDNLLIMHMLSQSHPSGSSKLKAVPPSNSQNNHRPRNNRREDTPKFVFGLSIQSMSYDFYGPPCPPTTPSSSSLGPTFNPINNIGNSSRGNVLSIGCSSFHFNSAGEYVDLVVKRSEATRRIARTRARKNEVYIPPTLRGIRISQAHEDSILSEKRPVDADSASTCREADSTSIKLSDESFDNLRDVGPHPQAYPLPNPSHSSTQWKSQVDVFREKSSVDFFYRLSFTWQTHSIDVVFQDDQLKLDKSRHPFASFDLPSRMSSSGPYDFFSLKTIEVTSEFCFAGRNIVCFDRKPVPTIDLTLREGTVQTFIEEVSFDLWRPNVLANLVAFTQTFQKFRRQSHPPETKNESDPDSASVPRTVPIPRDIAFAIAASRLSLRVAGFDPKRDSTIARGTQLVVSNALIECFRQSNAQPGLYGSPHRSRLDLQEDIRVQANAQLVHNPEFESCLLKCAMKKIEMFALPDLTGSLHSNRFSRFESPSHQRMFHYRSPSLWDDKARFGFRNHHDPQSPVDSTLHEPQDILSENKEVSILEVNRLACRTTLQILKQAKRGEDELILAVETGLITFHIDAFHIYCALMSISTLLNLAKKVSSNSPESAKRSAKSSTRLPIGIRAEISKIHFHMFLSHQVPIFIEIRRVSFQKSSKLGFDARWDILLLAGRSVTSPGRWDDLLKVKTCKVKLVQINPSNSPSDPALVNRGWHPFIVLIEGDAARLRIPFKFVIAEVIENVSLLVKTTKQLIYQFIHGGTGSVLQPEVEAPKRLPEIRIKFRIVCVQAEDDPFENKLNAIRRAGKEEVKDRLARDESFEQKVQGMNGPKNYPPTKETKPRQSWESHRHSERGSTDSPRNDDSSSFDSSSYLGRTGTQSPHVSIAQAAQRLNEYNGAAWIKRIRNALAEQERQEDAIQRQLYGHTATKLTDVMPVPMLPVTKATPLVRVVFNSIRIALYKADFEKDENGLMNYLHEVGKGLPKETKFSLIVPMHISWQMEGATMRLRDFPLYLFSLPRPQAQNGHQQERELSQYTWQFESDFVLAEEMCGVESIRAVQSVVIPSHHSSDGSVYTLDIPKSVMPVKSYADPFIKIKSTAPVQLGWGNSMQPTVQDMMRVLDSISKPPVDLSERVGFWDKVRLVLHWKVDVSFAGSKADVVLHLKGSRDPYELLGSGAGFAKVWRGNVKILLGHQNDEQEFLQIKSDQFIIGIPNLKDHINNAATGSAPMATATPAANYKRVYQRRSQGSGSDESDTETLSPRETEFIKIVGKLTNGVRWGMGIVLERACSDSLDKTCNCHGPAFHRKCRIFSFKPHYQVVTKTPQYGRAADGSPADSYEDFRSDFIHFSISLTSPTESGSRQKRPTGQNSLYFSAESFTHFWCWWKTFDSALALPIRQGNLFPSAQAPSKKFGRHVATIKYRFGISPLFLAHTYRYESAPDWVRGKNVVLGFKAKISTFNVDLHSRAVETTIRKPEMKEPKKLIRKAFYQAEIECQDVEIRALSAVFQTPRKSTYANDIGLTADQDESETNSIWEDSLEDESEFLVNPSGEEGGFSIYPSKLGKKDMEWIDLNDFSDIFFWPNSSGAQQPKIKMFDCLSCPRISFLRRPSSATSFQVSPTNNNASDGESIADGQPIERTKFGKENTHTCFIGKSEDPMKVQVGLIDARLKELSEKKYHCLVTAGSYHPQRPEDTMMLLQIEARMQTLRELKATMLRDKGNANRNSQSEDLGNQTNGLDCSESWADGERFLFEMAKQISDENSEWSNRLLVHNPSILISNSIRDILLKYYYSSSQRRAFMYHISARAVKFILDLAEQESSIPAPKPKQDFNKRRSRMRSFDYQKYDGRSNSGTGSKPQPKFPNEDCPVSPLRACIEEQAEQDVPDEFILDPADLVLLLRPQIAFRSEVDDISTVILTAFHAQFKSFEVLDPSHIDDPVNATVMKRNFGTVKGFQMFYPCNPSSSSSLHPAPGDQDFQVPIEVLVDLRLEPWGFDRLIGRCTVNIANDAFNQLRIKRRSAGADGSFSSATQPHLQTSTDLLRVEMADAVSVHATATHYRAIYNVITDLCLYIDPAQKKRNAALETMQFAYDVDDLEGMADQIQQQQARIRLYRNKLDEGYVDLNVFDEVRMAALTQCEYQLWIHASDLNLMVEAIRRSQASRLGRSKAEKLPGSQLLGHAKSITWHMLADSGEAIAKLSVTDTRFESYTLPDTSVSNRLYVQDMLALNISADSDRQFDEILSRYEPYNPLGPAVNSKQFLMVLWKTLPPIAGISIVESFLLEIHPIRLQVEHAIGVKVHDYLFAHKSTSVESENDSDEPSNTVETMNVPVVEGETKKLNKKRSMLLNLHQPKSRVVTPDLPDIKRRTGNFSTLPSQESLYDLHSVSGRSRTTESSGFLNADWRSSFGANQSTSGGTLSSRASRAVSVRSNSSDGRRQGASMGATPTVLMNWNKQKTEDATEMKKRAQLYKSFLFIDVAPTILCVSYSGPKYPDIFDLVVKVPPFHFESRTWSYSEFFDEIRRTCVSSLFKQSPSILGQIITTARKNKSVPKLMGQKMASGFKFKKRNLFERVNSQPTNTRHTSTSSLSSTLAGTTIDQGSSATSPDTNHSRSPYLSTDTSSSFEGYHSQSTQDATPRPAFFNQSPKQPYTYSSNGNSPTLGSLDLESCESINDFPEPDHSPPALDQRSRSYGGMDRPSPYAPQSRRQTHMRLSASDASHFHPHQPTRQRRQSEGPLSSHHHHHHLSSTPEPMPFNSMFFTAPSPSHP
ncbi:uncharacterized protein PGTG_17234 [Puccinia graminis f. sp. tritici CRL 75-36-700-3]|uniref:Uncharacterized protein n=1 Tax=Puccinia graminis f. sp. tritici (strain CRL 75-36-700-3 / race SCCL) TaxID=418459 RepID=E3L337_PUCGT|nr:uncharacterized protein PGTG_17234 [Puccinia graminis f. sp. tritici CRL 75-36-700-3]EFP90962.2 hypothetical protein PGTG_17234 [Puccinia graminis f. sp. tritici CRL 75-36-700-3]